MMTDDATNAPSDVVQVESVEVGKPITQAKPYDDDMLEVYEKESGDKGGDDTSVHSDGNSSDSKSEEVVKEEPKTEEELPPGERKGDKVEDNFEAVKVTKEINGKQVEFTVADAIKSHMERETFNREADRRITAITKKERAYQEDQAKLKGRVDKVFENLRTPGGLVGGIRALAKLAAGEDPNFNAVEFEKMYFKNLDEVSKVNKLPPEQQEAYWAKREAEDAKREAARLRADKQKVEDTTTLQQTVSQAQEQFGIPQEEFWDNYKFLAENDSGEGKRFASQQDIQIKDVVQYTFLVRHEGKVLEAGKRLGIDSEDVLNQISKHTIADPDLSVEDIVEIVNQSGIAKRPTPEAVENLNRKAEKSNIRFSQGNLTKKENGIPEGYDQETLEELYRNQPKKYQRIIR